jgi:cell division protein FtsX
MRRALLFFLTLLFLPGLARADLQQYTAALAPPNSPDRSAASAQSKQNADYIADQLARITRVPVRRQPFLLTLPIVEQCSATDPDNKAIPLAPLLPSGGQPAALKPDQRSAPLLYVGKGTLEELRGKDLAGKFIALDADSDSLAWQQSAALAARAIIFLGDRNTTTSDLLTKHTDIPLAIPRFYCDDPDAVGRIKSHQLAALKIEVAVRWEEKRLENLFSFFPGTLGGGGTSGQQYVILHARYDASSQVLGRAPGATQAADAAALLEIARQLARNRHHISVLFLFTAGDEWNFRGTRAALDLLQPDISDPVKAIASLRKDAADVTTRLQAAQRIFAGITQITAGDLSPLSSQEIRTAVEDQLLRESSLVEDQLQRARAARPQDPTRTADLTKQKQNLLAATSALAPGRARGGAQTASIHAAAARLSARWRTEINRLAELRSDIAEYPALRDILGARSPMLFLSVALTSGSPRYGFFARSDYSPDLDASGKSFSQAFRRYTTSDPGGAGFVQSGFVPESTEKRFTLESFFPVNLAFSSDAALARGVSAGAFATVQDPTPFLDTPNDTLDHLNFDNLVEQTRSLANLLAAEPRPANGAAHPGSGGALLDPAFYIRNELDNKTADQTVTLFERTAGESLPRLHAAECLLGGKAETFDGRPLGPPLATVRRFDWHLTYVDGSAQFTSAPRDARTRLQAFDFDAAGQPQRTLAANQADIRGMAADFTPDPDRAVRAMLFDARRLDCYGLFDPRYLDTLDKIEVLDARRLDKAQYTNIYTGAGDGGSDGSAAVFLPQDIRWQLLVAKGALNNRMILINADAQSPTGKGFDTTDLATLGPLAWRNVLDLEALNGKRHADLEKFGISSQIVSELRHDARQQIDIAREARKKRDYPAFYAATDAAWSLESQIYQTLIDTSNGIIKGVIFLLLGIIPFSYFLERLLIGATTVYRQIVGFATIFALMTAALWFHPAFRISSAPLMILLAFLILILSSAVVYILWGKFEEEIARIRASRTGSGGGGMHSTSLRRAAVLGAAIRLGLSNMRRRGTRTALTLLTLILLTFTLLCFTSVTETVQITPKIIHFPAGATTPPAGILLRQQHWATLPPQAIDLAAGIADSRDAKSNIATRWWYSSEKSDEPWLIPLRTPSQPAPVVNANATISRPGTGRTFYASALLGLDATEATFQSAPIQQILPGFADMATRRNICWLPIEISRSMDVEVGDDIDVLGHRLKVAGFFDDAAYRKLRQLTGDPLSPLDPAGGIGGGSGGAQDQSGRSPRAAEPTYRFVSSSNLAIVPASLVEQLGGRLTSIMLRPSADTPVFTLAEQLARRSAFNIYASDGTQVRSINANFSSEPRDFGAVLIPMLIAGVIILNTMLGAVSERTREIHVYTSIGLAPSHVGMLFLAEAAALGTIGVVSGYIFGQGLATILSYTHLLPGVDLNYSSLSAIVTMGLVLMLVMLSALWPARSATRVAAPSLDRKW